jgi:hypothetical protein
MSPKAKSKSRSASSKLKSRRTVKGKSHSKKLVSTRKAAVKTRKKTAIAKTRIKGSASPSNKIVRIMGHGQFTVDNSTLKKLNDIDNTIVGIVSVERSDDMEFKKK